jgi:hypothetical protein
MPATVLYRTIKSWRISMKQTVNHAVGTERFAQFPLFRSTLRTTSNSNRHRADVEQNRLLLAIAGVWLLILLVVVMWTWRIMFG